MYITREIEKTVVLLAAQYPIVTITGPRQSGKTTLVKKLFPEKPYFSLENPDLRETVQSDPRAFVNRIQQGAILDEVQRVPEFFSYLQEVVDSRPLKGQYILTGSNQFALLNSLTQSLAGRTVLLKLLPLTINELEKQTGGANTDDYLLNGFYPAIYGDRLNPSITYRSYYETYIERDLRQLIHIKDLLQFQRFVRLCAGRVGQVFNASSLANEVGTSAVTIKSWLSILQASYIVMLLPPYFENFGKRLIKAAKLYFYDVGLATYLLGIESTQQLARDPLRGALFENMVLMELIKTRTNRGLDPQFHFYRDNHQNEIDILFKRGSDLLPVEIKSAQTFHADFLKGLRYLQKIMPERFKEGYLVYDGQIEQKIDTFDLVNFRRAAPVIFPPA